MNSSDKDRCAKLIDELLRRDFPRARLEPAIEWLLGSNYTPPKETDLQYAKCHSCNRPIHKDNLVGDARGHFPTCLVCRYTELYGDFQSLQSEFNKLRILRGG